LGGIPMTAVIVRGSTNLQAGGRTQMSAFAHGAFLVVAVLAVPGLINRIPLASLAAVLLSVGYRLAKPQNFAEMFRRSSAHWAPFLLTVGAVVFTDLLSGVLAGLALAILFVIAEGVLAPRRRAADVLVKLGPVMPFLSRVV